MQNNVYLIDFDGTITHQDTTTTVGRVVDSEFTNQKVQELKEDKINIKEYMTSVFKNIKLNESQFYACLSNNITIDSYFESFIKEFTNFYIFSSGTVQNILFTLDSKGINLEKNRIIANRLEFNPEGIDYILHECNSENGLDKKSYIKKLKEENPDMNYIFIGDGISDVDAASEADYVYARKGKALSKHCKDLNIPHTDFESFDEIEKHLKSQE